MITGLSLSGRFIDACRFSPCFFFWDTHTHTHTHISQRIIYSLWDLAPLHVVREDVKLGNLWSLPVVTFQDYVSKEWEIG